MPDISELRLRTGQLVTEDWYDALVDFLELLGYGGAISAYGYVTKDLVAIQDLLINLGIPLRRFKELWAGYGYFSYDLFVQGMRVIKDGDPITVSDLGTSAVTKITSAVDGSTVVKGSQLRPALSGYKINYSAPDMGDIFSPALTMLLDGRARFKFVVSYNVYAYTKHRLVGQATDVIASLNAGAIIPVGAWHEFDFTVLQNDQVNARITPATTISIIVYNIPNA